MPEVKKDYIPLTEVKSPKLRFAASLPSFVDLHSIGINLNRVNLLCRLGGISHLKIEGSADQKTSSFIPTIVGFDAHGNAYAAKTGAKTSVPTYTVDSQQDNERLLASRWVNGIVKINVDETTTRILSETRWRNGVNSSDAWSYHLNRIIKGSIVDIGTKHLVLGARRIDYLAEILPVMQITYNFLNGGFNLTEGLGTYGFWYFWANVIGSYLSERNPEGWRHSLFLYGPQLDRALLLKIISLKSTLVKRIPVSTG